MKAKIISVTKDEDKFNIILESTSLRLAGGGQPCDHGTMEHENYKLDIIDIQLKDNKTIHICKGEGEPKENDEVELTIDKERRKTLTRMHSGEHILFKALQNNFDDLELDKIYLEEDISRFFITCPDNLDWDKVLKAEKEANWIVEAQIPIKETTVQKNDAGKLAELRIKPERIKGESVRIIEIGDFDMSACMGTHCKNTQDIGNIFILDIKGCGKNKYEIQFTTNSLTHLDYANQTRKIADLLNADEKQLAETIAKLKQNNEELTKKLRDQATSQAKNIKAKHIGRLKLYTHIFDDIEKKQMTDVANEYIEKEKFAVIAFINQAKSQLILVSAQIDVSEILKQLMPKIGGKGGGGKNFAMCGFDTKNINSIFEDIISILNRS